MACWRTKAAISLKREKIEEKLLWTAYRNSPTLFQGVPKIFIAPIYRAHCGHLCDSTAFLSVEVKRGQKLKTVE